jgi:lysophospholipase L1-like esterase
MHAGVQLLARIASTVALAVGSVLAWPDASSQTTGPTDGPLRVVALGDSVTSGYACGCAAFPALYGRLLGRAEGIGVRVDNFGVAGLDTGGLLDRLRQDTGGVAGAVGAADVVLLTVGANDFGDHHDVVTAGRCTGGPGADCVSDELDLMRRTLAGILSEIRTLRAGPPATVLVTGYWNDFEDGAVARARYPDAGLAASARLTRRTNRAMQDAIDEAAPGARATYVDLEAAFHRRGTDATDLLADDGDHPNAAGHRLIAHLLVRAGLPRLPAA